MYRTVITAEEFVAAYEKTGLGVTNDWWVRDGLACALGAMYVAEGGPKTKIEDGVCGIDLTDFLNIPYEDSGYITTGFERGLRGRKTEEFHGRNGHAHMEAYKAGLKLREMGKSPYGL